MVVLSVQQLSEAGMQGISLADRPQLYARSMGFAYVFASMNAIINSFQNIFCTANKPTLYNKGQYKTLRYQGNFIKPTHSP